MQRGWTQEFLAEQAEVGLTSVSHIEQSLRWPEFSSVKKIAKALGVRQSLLFVEEFAPPPNPTIPEALQRIAQDYGLEVRKPRRKRKPS